ncbi:MAG: hypothetical protein ABFC98_07035 [Candidatus Cloacimonas sp.]
MLHFALYASNHGFGHSTRLCALAEELINYGVFCHIISAKPAYLFNNLNPHYYVLHQRSIDVGVKHKEDLQVDLEKTVSSILDLLSQRNEIMEQEIEFLRREKIDCIIADVPYLVSDFAAYCQIPVFAVTNFEWYYIYKSLSVLPPTDSAAKKQISCCDKAEYETSLNPVLNLIWSLYQRFDACFQLPLSTKDSMSAFKEVIHCGLLARKKERYNDIRQIYGWEKTTSILLIMFGGEGKLKLNYEELCKAFKGIVISSQTGVKAKNHFYVPMNADFLDLIYNANIILCKPGYSTLAEAVQMNKFIIYCPRKNYPEEKALIAGLKKYPNCLQIDSLQKETQEWKDIFNNIQVSKTHSKLFQNANQQVSALILQKYTQMISNQLISVFDLGSNNLNYLLYDIQHRQIIHKTQLTTSLGKNFKNDQFSIRCLQRVQKIITPLLQTDAYLPSEKVLLATGVMRKATNATKLTDWIANNFGIKCKIISPQEEIRYVYYAAKHYESGEEASLAIDIGGFSTEFVNLNQTKTQPGYSLPFGLLTLLNDRYKDSKEAKKYIENQLDSLPYEGSYKLIGIGLTYVYLAAVIYKCNYNEVDKLEGKTISKDALQQLSHFLDVNAEINYLPYLLKESYLPVLKLSISFTISLLDRFKTQEIIVCNSGISVGYANWYSDKKANKENK